MSRHGDSAGEAADHFFRHEGAKVVATLTAHLGTHRLQLAEDVVQEALLRALQTWSYRGVPDNPAAWLTQVAKNLALNALQREQRWNEKQEGIAAEHTRWLSSTSEDMTHETFADDTLRLMFVCFHPELAAESQIALALRTLCGFSPAEIAAAFLTSEAAIAKRLVRARQRIRELALPFAVPDILHLYDQLLALTGSPVTAMNRAVAVARVHGAQAGLDALDTIRQRSVLEGNHLYHSMRGTFAAELGQTAAAVTHFRQAAKLALLPIERDFIARRIEEYEAATKP